MSRQEIEIGSDIARISVIVVSYHTGPLLDRAIRSILEQDALFELIIVDNGNPGAVTAALRKRALKDERIHVMTGHGNVGFARACNMGARRASGDVLFFLNPDTELPPRALRDLYTKGGNSSRPWMLGAKLVNPDGSEQRGARRDVLTPWSAIVEGSRIYRLVPNSPKITRFNRHEDETPEEKVPTPVISGACMMIPREDYWSIDGMDEGFFLHVEDVDFCFRFRKAGGGIYFVPNVEILHDMSGSSANGWVIEWHKAKGFLRYFWKNFRPQYSYLALAAVSTGVMVLFAARLAAVALQYLTEPKRGKSDSS